MTKFNQKKFNKFVLDQKVVGFFDKPIKLVSGRMSSWYANWRGAVSDVYLIDDLSDFVIDFIKTKRIGVDCFYGTPDGATKLAVICQYKWSKAQKSYKKGKFVMAMGRKTPKDHGEPKDRFFVGAPKGRVVVLEDVTTTGGSLLRAVEVLLKMKINVVAAIALTNRNEVMDNGRHVSEVLAKKGVKYFAMSNALGLLPIIVKRKRVSKKIKESIIEEFEKYGEKEIDL